MTSIEQQLADHRSWLIARFPILALAAWSSRAGTDALDASVTAIGTAAEPERAGHTPIRPSKFNAPVRVTPIK